MHFACLWSTYISLKPQKPYFNSTFRFKIYRLYLQIILQISLQKYLTLKVHNKTGTFGVAFPTFTDPCTTKYTSIYLLLTSTKQLTGNKSSVYSMWSNNFNIKLIILGVKYNTYSCMSDTATEIKYHYRRILWYWRHHLNMHSDHSRKSKKC